MRDVNLTRVFVKVAAKSAGIRRLLAWISVSRRAAEPSRTARPSWAQRLAH